MIAWLIARERWLPAAAGLAWWATFHPGFIGEDSIINLTEVRSGELSVWFTAWWLYVVDALSLGTRAIALLTLAGVLILEYAVYAWIVTVFPAGRPRAITVAVMSAIPLVGALGIQVRHDVFMTSGLLLCAAVLARTWQHDTLRAIDYAALGLSIPLIATRHNGMPTVLATAAMLLAARKWRQSAALMAVAAGAAVITYGATRAAGHAESVHPVQTVEWLMADISCALARGAVTPTEEEWSTLTRIAGRDAWPQSHACVAMNPMMNAPSFNSLAVTANYRELIGVWRSLTLRYPIAMTSAHASRVRLFLPPLATGIPDTPVINFLHSTIMPNDFGLAWTFPSLAERARVVVRAWNALGLVLANSALWLIALVIVAVRWPEHRAGLVPAICLAIALNLGLLVAAPISEGRYGLFILICGQAATVYAVCRRSL